MLLKTHGKIELSKLLGVSKIDLRMKWRMRQKLTWMKRMNDRRQAGVFDNDDIQSPSLEINSSNW